MSQSMDHALFGSADIPIRTDGIRVPCLKGIALRGFVDGVKESYRSITYCIDQLLYRFIMMNKRAMPESDRPCEAAWIVLEKPF